MNELEILRWENQYLKSKDRFLATCRSVSDTLEKSLREKSIKCDVAYRIKSWDSIT